jgi:mevalonate pyrophosphate decarboxylase
MILTKYEEKFFQEWKEELRNRKNYSEYVKGMDFAQIQMIEFILKISEVKQND